MPTKQKKLLLRPIPRLAHVSILNRESGLSAFTKILRTPHPASLSSNWSRSCAGGFDMTQRSPLATTLLMVCMCGAAPLQKTSFAQEASVPKQPDKAAIATKT
jgi:hypothetical protein